MSKNPISDVWQFLTATTSDYLQLGNWRYLILALFWALLVVSIAIAWQNWREDPEQRTGKHLGTWVVRVLIGCMWFEAMLTSGTMNASTSPDMIQLATDCSRYWTDLAGRKVRVGSG